MDISRMPKEGDKFGNWIIERTLDKGGMGMVYLAYNPDLGKSEKVALKVLDPTVAERDADFVKRFYQEASIVFKTHCPNLVSIHDAGRDTTSGFYYIVMEYLGGGTLRGKMRSQGRMPWREALAIIRPVALALSAVAKRQSVHRDIKPENIMFTEEGIVKLADFGIAKAAQDDVPENADPLKTRALQVFGTPAYMSPEQMSDASAVDARADIWSLGVVLFEMLAGVRPYPARDLIQAGAFLLSPKPFPDIRTFKIPVENATSQVVDVTMQTQPTMATQATCVDTLPCKSPTTSEQEITVSVPDGVAELLLKMCNKKLAERFATSEEVVAAIDALLKDANSQSVETVAAPVPTEKSATRTGRQNKSITKKPNDTSKRTLLRIICGVLILFLAILCGVVFLKPRSVQKKEPTVPQRREPAKPVNPTPVIEKEAATNDSVAVSNVPPVIVTPPPASKSNAVVVVTNTPPPPNPVPPLRPISTSTVQVALFQPQRGTVDAVLSQLDTEINKKPAHLKVSLSIYAQRKDLSVERYEQQLLIPAVERLRTSGVSYSLVPGSGKYGSTVQDVAKRFGCDVE